MQAETDQDVAHLETKIGFCKLWGDGVEYYANKYDINLGRRSKSTVVDVVIGDNVNISRKHASIIYSVIEKTWQLHVYGKNGVTVKNTLYTPSSDPVSLQSGDLLQLGDTAFFFLLEKGSRNAQRGAKKRVSSAGGARVQKKATPAKPKPEIKQPEKPAKPDPIPTDATLNSVPDGNTMVLPISGQLQDTGVDAKAQKPLAVSKPPPLEAEIGSKRPLEVDTAPVEGEQPGGLKEPAEKKQRTHEEQPKQDQTELHQARTSATPLSDVSVPLGVTNRGPVSPIAGALDRPGGPQTHTVGGNQVTVPHQPGIPQSLPGGEQKPADSAPPQVAASQQAAQTQPSAPQPPGAGQTTISPVENHQSSRQEQFERGLPPADSNEQAPATSQEAPGKAQQYLDYVAMQNMYRSMQAQSPYSAQPQRSFPEPSSQVQSRPFMSGAQLPYGQSYAGQAYAPQIQLASQGLLSPMSIQALLQQQQLQQAQRAAPSMSVGYSAPQHSALMQHLVAASNPHSQAPTAAFSQPFQTPGYSAPGYGAALNMNMSQAFPTTAGQLANETLQLYQELQRQQLQRQESSRADRETRGNQQ